MSRSTWAKGDKATLADQAGISQQKLCDFLKRRRQADATTAERLTVEARLMGYETSIFDWMFSRNTDNPLFG